MYMTFSEVNTLPNALVLEQKQKQVAELKEKISAAVTGVVVDYKGISVADDTKLRKELRESGVDYFVVKNTILGRAIEGTDLEEMQSVLEGTTAIALSNEDYTAAARILCKFAETNESFTVKSGFLDGKVVDVATIESLAKLPTKEVLLATVCSAFQAPIAAFARAVQAIVDKEEE
jgi:large subunit ribosomal protein L10